jgi:hypothetical protein
VQRLGGLAEARSDRIDVSYAWRRSCAVAASGCAGHVPFRSSRLHARAKSASTFAVQPSLTGIPRIAALASQAPMPFAAKPTACSLAATQRGGAPSAGVLLTATTTRATVNSAMIERYDAKGVLLPSLLGRRCQ